MIKYLFASAILATQLSYAMAPDSIWLKSEFSDEDDVIWIGTENQMEFGMNIPRPVSPCPSLFLKPSLEDILLIRHIYLTPEGEKELSTEEKTLLYKIQYEGDTSIYENSESFWENIIKKNSPTIVD